MFRIVFLMITLLGVSDGSLGDMDPHFRLCVRECSFGCGNLQQQTYDPGHVTSWSCGDTCKYGCMTEITHLRVANGYPVLKYDGHWPFRRYFGLEEPASVVFSVMNMASHVSFLWTLLTDRIFLQDSRLQRYYMTPWLILYAASACNAWVASAVFHSQKTAITAKYDYVSALAFLFCGLLVALRRVGGHSASYFVVTSVSIAVTAMCVAQVSAMLSGLVTFDGHMRYCVGLVAATTGLWVLWAILSGDGSRESRRHRCVCLAVQTWLVLASALEVFDFPPILETFDAHSLWHAATVPLGFVWYRCFWLTDCHMRQCSVETGAGKPIKGSSGGS